MIHDLWTIIDSYHPAGGQTLKKFRRSLKSAVERAALKDPVVMYDIRHLFPTKLLREGGDAAAASKLMGHSTIKMTVDQYQHLLGDEKRWTIAKLPSLPHRRQEGRRRRRGCRSSRVCGLSRKKLPRKGLGNKPTPLLCLKYKAFSFTII
jgi:hypothetical protein